MKYSVLFFLVLILLSVHVIGQGVIINEFMSDNETTIQDEDGDFKDWIELYNNSDTPVNLLNYSISDDDSNLDKWVFPQKILNPHDYLLLFASGKNRTDTNELHTNFKISSGGEELFLSDSSGLLVDQTASVSLMPDETYARVPDGSPDWIKCNTPSPAMSNNLSNILTFSADAGFYTTPFFLILNSLSGDSIYFTLNGDIPDNNSFLFSDSVLIDYKASDPNVFSEIPTTPEQSLISYKAWELPDGLVDKATVLRCASFSNGIRTSRIYTKTFFVVNNIFDKYTLPVISLVTDGNNLFNPDSGIYVPGVNFDINNPQWTGNYFKDGTAWERPVHIEYFEPDGSPGFSQDAGVRIHGGKSRVAAQKSLRLYARKEYGEKYFNYRLLPQRPVEKYKRFILRTTMSGWGKPAIIKDVVAQNISSGLNIDYQEFQPAIVYINGEYWGIHTIRDRIDERYIEYTHYIDKDSVEFYEPRNSHYDSLMEYIELNDLSDNGNYEYIKNQIDIDNYIDYYIAEQFFKNYDWPANNMKIWRDKSPEGKWRWVFYDLDAGFGNPEYNMLVHSTLNDNGVVWPNSPASTFLYRNLLKNNNFTNQFISRYAEVLNNAFNVDTMAGKLNTIKEIYAPEIADHILRWNFPDSYADWEDNIEDEMISFIEDRPCYVESNIISFFNITEFDFLCEMKVNNNSDGTKLILSPNPGNGVFYIFNKASDINNATVTITDISGRTVAKITNFSISKNQHNFLNLSYLTGNLYFLRFESDVVNEQIKFIIVK